MKEEDSGIDKWSKPPKLHYPARHFRWQPL